MTVWLNEAKGDSKFAVLTLDDTAKVVWSEACIRSSENYIQVYGWVDNCSNVTKMGDSKYVFQPQLASFKLTRKDYEIEYNGKKSAKKATPASTYYCELLESKVADGYCKGFIDLSIPDVMVNSLISGKDPSGKELTPEVSEFMLNNYFAAIAVGVDKLKDVPIPEGNGGKKTFGKGGGYSQSKLDQLRDTLTFIDECAQDGSQFKKTLATLLGGASPEVEASIDDVANPMLIQMLHEIVSSNSGNRG